MEKNQTQNFSEKISEILKERNALNCPACGENNSMILGGIFARAVGGKHALPCAVVVCKNCGFIREHAVEPLGIKVMTKQKDSEKNTSENI